MKGPMKAPGLTCIEMREVVGEARGGRVGACFGNLSSSLIYRLAALNYISSR